MLLRKFKRAALLSFIVFAVLYVAAAAFTLPIHKRETGHYFGAPAPDPCVHQMVKVSWIVPFTMTVQDGRYTDKVVIDEKVTGHLDRPAMAKYRDDENLSFMRIPKQLVEINGINLESLPTGWWPPSDAVFTSCLDQFRADVTKKNGVKIADIMEGTAVEGLTASGERLRIVSAMTFDADGGMKGYCPYYELSYSSTDGVHYRLISFVTFNVIGPQSDDYGISWWIVDLIFASLLAFPTSLILFAAALISWGKEKAARQRGDEGRRFEVT